MSPVWWILPSGHSFSQAALTEQAVERTCFFDVSWNFEKKFWTVLFRAGNSLIGFAKNERMSDSLKKTSDLLICSFLVSDLSDSLIVNHFWQATWVNCSWSLIFGERPEQFAHIAHFWWATGAICSPKMREWRKRSFFNLKNLYITYRY